MRLGLTIWLGLGMLAAYAAEDSWRLPLAEKAVLIEQDCAERHNILGLYPSQVEVPLDGSPVDNSTLGIGNIAHSVCWTANYLAGASYRYAFLKQRGALEAEVAAAKARADELFEAVYRCQLVTGVRGLQARGYAIGHGESYEERWDDPTRNEWHQGAGDYRDLRWRGDPSHHNYSDSAHGLMQYWRLAAEGAQKDRARDAIDALVSYWVDNDLMIYKLDRSQLPTPILGFTDGSTLNTRVMMAIAAAKYAHVVTGQDKFKAAYDKLTTQYGVRGLKSFIYEKGFDDAEHVFCHLENLMRIEDDPELLAGYRVVLDTMWSAHRDDGQSLFTYIYAGLSPDAPDMEKPLEQALRALRTWPVESTLEPRMNSLTKKYSAPFPVYAAAWDNEYIWKNNLLRGDGWLSRTVTDLEVPEEDPVVIYAVEDDGSVYQSRDGATTAAGWRPIDDKLPSPAVALACGPKVRMVYLACRDGFYLSMTGGHTWQRMPVPADGGQPADIQLDPNDPFVLYATTTRGAYRSPNFGEEFLGQSWESLTAGLPTASSMQFYVAPGGESKPGRVYALLDDICFSRTLDNPAWTRGGDVGMRRFAREYADAYSWFAIDPSDPDHVFTGMKTDFGGMGTKSLLQETRDAGVTWTNDIKSLYEKFHTGGLLIALSALLGGDLSTPVFDPQEPNVIYSGTQGGVVKSTDGGTTWNKHGVGLDIPWARTVFAPRHSDRLWAGTPAGLYLSNDGAKTWEPAHLVLQFIKNTRREIGGAAYIDAYWRARYYGLINDDMANAPAQE